MKTSDRYYSILKITIRIGNISIDEKPLSVDYTYENLVFSRVFFQLTNLWKKNHPYGFY